MPSSQTRDYSDRGLFRLIPRTLPEEDRIACGWILWLVNHRQRILYSLCNEDKKAAVDRLIEDEILEVKENVVQFSTKFQTFMKSRT